MLLISHEMHKQSSLGIAAESCRQRCDVFPKKKASGNFSSPHSWSDRVALGPGAAVRESHSDIPGSTAFVCVTLGLRL